MKWIWTDESSQLPSTSSSSFSSSFFSFSSFLFLFLFLFLLFLLLFFFILLFLCPCVANWPHTWKEISSSAQIPSGSLAGGGFCHSSLTQTLWMVCHSLPAQPPLGVCRFILCQYGPLSPVWPASFYCSVQPCSPLKSQAFFLEDLFFLKFRQVVAFLQFFVSCMVLFLLLRS